MEILLILCSHKKWGVLHFSQPGTGVNKPHHIITLLQINTYLTRLQCRLLWPQGNLCWYRMTQLVLFLCCNLDQHPYCHLVHPSCMSDQQKKNITSNILCFQGMVVTGAYKVTTVNTQHVHILCRCASPPSTCNEPDTHTSVCHE